MIWGILFLGLLLRLINLNQSLWLDESINVLAAKNLDFWHFVTGYPIGDFHPPLYFGILWIWGHVFGFSEISVRIPSIIFGLGTIYLTYLLGKEFFSKKVGLIASLLLAVGPLHVYYSQEARMYSLAAFAVILSFYFFIRLIKDKRYLIPYGISIILVLYSDYLPYLAIFSQVIYLLIFERKQIKSFFGAFGLAVMAFIPWLFIFPEQLANGRQTAVNVTGWANVVGGANIKNVLLIFIKTIVGRIGLVNKVLYGILVMPAAIIYGLLIIKALFKDKKSILLIFWFLLPIIIAFLISFLIPVLSYFRLIFILPAFYLLTARGLQEFNKNLSKTFLIVIMIFSLGFLLTYYINPKFQREDWKGLSAFLLRNSDNQTLTLFEDGGYPAPFEYYKQPINASGALNKFPAVTINDAKIIENDNYDKIYLVDYLVEIADPNRVVDQRLTLDGWRVVDVHNFNGVGLVYEYKK